MTIVNKYDLPLGDENDKISIDKHLWKLSDNIINNRKHLEEKQQLMKVVSHTSILYIYLETLTVTCFLCPFKQ